MPSGPHAPFRRTVVTPLMSTRTPCCPRAPRVRRRQCPRSREAAASRSLRLLVRLLVLAAVLASVRPLHACTTFLLEHEGCRVFGNNYDWNVDDGLIIVNKRGVVKEAVADSNPARWTSRFGSVTVNQYGREMPHGGINEAGLAIGLMWLATTRYSRPDHRAALGELEWIQYQLDNCASVGEVIRSRKSIRICPRGPAPIHYFVCDSSGACAVIELLEGRAVVHTGDELPVTVLTNNTYAASISAARQCRAFGGPRPLPSGTSSLARFIRAASLLRRPQPSSSAEAVDAAWNVLSAVSMGDYTAWSLVYDLKKRCIYVKTRRRRRIKRLALDDLRFGCARPVRVLDINARVHGNIAPRMKAYTFECNRDLIARSFARTDFLQHMTESDIDFNARIPSTHTHCADEREGDNAAGKGETK